MRWNNAERSETFPTIQPSQIKTDARDSMWDICVQHDDNISHMSENIEDNDNATSIYLCENYVVNANKQKQKL